MQIFKWTVIVLLLISFLPEECQASFSRKEDQTTACSLRSENSSLEHFMDAIISFLSSHSGNLTEYCYHNSYDKKNFLRLFINPGYTQVSPPAISQYAKVSQHPVFTFSAPVDHYVYSLREIII